MTARMPRRKETSGAQQREPRVRRTGRTAGGKVEPLYPRQKRNVRGWWNLIFEAVPCVGKEQWKRNQRRMNGYVFWVTVILVLFGLAMVYSTTSFAGDDPLSGVKKQAVFALVGLGAMLLLSRLDYHRLLCLSWCQLYALSTFLLVATLAFGRSSHGRTRWIRLGPVSFQPSELMKTALVLFFAVYLVNEYRRFARKPEQIIWVMAVFGGVPAYLVSRQNLSTGLLIASLVFFITFLGVKSIRIHIGIILLAAFAFWIVVNYYKQMPFLKAYQIGRIDNWLHPVTKLRGQPDQVTGGKFGLSIGSWLGTGIGRGYIKRDLPEAANDIILAVIGEELGLVGICILLLFYLSLLFCIIQTALKAPDRYGALLCGGVAIHIFLHTAMNIMVVTGAMPNTGVTLPFVSSGGTSLLCFMAEIALVLSVSREVRPEKPL